jgi:hypothetical protein
VIATQSQQSPQSMVSGTIVNNTTVQANAVITYEGVLTDIQVLNGAEGAPILDQCGYVIGIVTGRSGVHQQGASAYTASTVAGVTAVGGTNYVPTSQGTVNNIAVALQPLRVASAGAAFGVSASFINLVVDRLIEADLRPACSSFVLYNDIFGFNIYRHAALKICYYYRQGADIGLLAGEVVYPAYQERWYDPAYCEINRQLIGIVLKDNPVGSLADAYEDCRALQFPVFQNKTVIAPNVDFIGYQISPMDKITGINGLQVGQLPTQITPDTLLYNLRPCDTVNVEFMKANESYTQCHNLCTSLDDSLAFLFNLPPIYNQTSQTVTVTNDADYKSILIWFFLSLSQVNRAFILSQYYNGSIRPQTDVGYQLLQDLVAGTAQNYIDPFGLLNTANNAVIVPAIDVNLNCLNQIISNTNFTTQFAGLLY